MVLQCGIGPSRKDPAGDEPAPLQGWDAGLFIRQDLKADPCQLLRRAGARAGTGPGAPAQGTGQEEEAKPGLIKG